MEIISNIITPRNYQYEHIDSIIRKLGTDRCTVAQLPTGGGKTVEFALIINRYIQKYHKSVLILVHRKELLEQAKNTLHRMFGIEASLIVQGVTYVVKNRVYIGMVESVNTRADKMQLLDLGLVIIDECHIGNFIKMFEIFTEEKIIGFTATPISASKKHPLCDYYQSISVGPQIKQLIAMGYLSQNYTRCPQEVVDTSMLLIDSKTHDYETRALANEFKKQKFVLNTFRYYQLWCAGKKTLIFNVNIEHSLEVTQCFSFFGVKCRHIDGNMGDKEREETLEWFKQTKDAVLCNVGIVGVGFDEPTIKWIIVNLATLSVTKWLQCDGRGGRIIDSSFIEKFQKDYSYQLEEKYDFGILDLGANYAKHGDWNDDRDWERMFKYPDRPGAPGLAPVKVCPDCFGLVHAASLICQLPVNDLGDVCGHIFDRKKYQEKLKFDDLLLVTRNVKAENLTNVNGKEPYFVFYEMGRIYARNVIECGVRLDEQQLDTIFKDYFDKVIDWHKKTFPDKAFNKEWHLSKARKHFYDCVQKYKALNSLLVRN